MSPNPLRSPVESPSCAHPNFVSSGHAYARLNATQLGSVHLPGDVRRTHVRRSRHLPFYDPKVEGRQVTQRGPTRALFLTLSKAAFACANSWSHFWSWARVWASSFCTWC
ncbi:hypothetical protein CRG98_021032 [Punica granatum]|uniref:Uncharacterized protein n=1 Tax=Punica granatum TaxID=22663 RepID=A0A2I0JQJ5_PUNGR|nr:hypothetical protein CRG98_021032 [Punica granatum]